jgi:hypothetical protein
MVTDQHDDDVRAINQIISRQFASLSWAPGTSGKWEAFAADFLPNASLYPAARPAKRQNVEGFIDRMKDVQGSKLHSFHEAVLGTDVRVFGNVAVALAGCEITENETEVNRGVEMLMLIKNEGVWQIVSQAWDTETASNKIPQSLLVLSPAPKLMKCSPSNGSNIWPTGCRARSPRWLCSSVRQAPQQRLSAAARSRSGRWPIVRLELPPHSGYR